MAQNAHPAEKISTPEQIHQIARGFQASRVLLTAFELGVFSALNENALTSATVADKLDTDTRATDRLLNALVSLGLVKKSGNLFSNTPVAAKHLVFGKPGYQAGLGHANNLWDSWSGLTGAVIRNQEKTEAALRKKGESWYPSFIAAMDDRAHKAAPPIVGQLEFGTAEHLLDVGGGSGAFSIQFVKQGKARRATILDQAHVVEMTNAYLEKAGLFDKIDVIARDYTKDNDFGSGYDLVFLSAILHSNSPETNQVLLTKCHGALKPGGRIAINDFIMNEDRTEPAMGTLFSLNMLVATEEGDSFTEGEIGAWMETAGFKNIHRLAPLGPASTMVGEKR